jgi:hypothetical protein
MVTMSELFPYEKYRGSVLWNVLQKSLVELAENQDLIITTDLDYVVGYLAEKLSEVNLIK